MALGENPPIFELAIRGWRYAVAALSRMAKAVADEYSATFDAAEQGWRDALMAIPKMLIVLAVGMLVVLAPRFLHLGPGRITNPTPDQLFWFQVHSYIAQILLFIAQGFLLTPVAIAMHRFVLLGEVAQRYTISFSPRFLRFFAFSVAFQILIAAPSLLSWAVTRMTGPENWIVWSVISYGSLTVAMIAALRLLILFPAIAVDAPRASWRNAMADTKGHTWRVFFVVLVTAIPILGLRSALPNFLVYVWQGLQTLVDKIWCFVSNEKIACSAPGFISNLTFPITDLTFTIAFAAIEIFSLSAYAAVASRLYAAFANRLKPASVG